MNREQAEALTILRCEVGSTAHGISIGNDDLDHMGILIEPMQAAVGVHAPFEQFIYRSAAEREGRHDAPSQPGDLDLTFYSLRKYVRLALKGNPTVLMLLFAQPVQCDARGSQLRELTQAIVSRAAGSAFLGYLQAQRQRLVGERGMKVHRRGLEAKHGYDVKFAGHMVRLGLQGIELLKTGRFSLPMSEADRADVLAIRRGESDLQTCLTRAGELEAELRDLLHGGSPIQPEPDVARVEDWMVRVYFRAWSADRKTQDIREDVERFAVGTT